MPNIISPNSTDNIYFTPYKSYEANLTQNYVGGTSGLLIIGDTYLINVLNVGDDFSNIGFVAEFTPFVATGTTPINWTNGTVAVNLTQSAPVAVVFNSNDANYLGDIVWTWGQAGNYFGGTANKFTQSKTIAILSGTGGFSSVTWYDDSTINLATFDQSGVQKDGWLYITSIEIRVYP